MRKFFVNTFATTGISIIILSVIALLYQAKCIYLEAVFQILATNIVVHFALFVLRKLEPKYIIIEMFLHIAVILSVLVAAGAVFHWFISTPLWVLVIMGFVIYIISAILDLIYMKQEAQEMNALIKKRNSKI